VRAQGDRSPIMRGTDNTFDPRASQPRAAPSHSAPSRSATTEPPASTSSPSSTQDSPPSHWQTFPLPPGLGLGLGLGFLPPDPLARNVLVWDLDETLVVFQSLLDGRFASVNGDPAMAAALGAEWESLILRVSDENLFFDEVHMEECDEMGLHALDAFDDGRDLEAYEFTTDALHLNNAAMAPQHLLQLMSYRLRVRLSAKDPLTFRHFFLRKAAREGKGRRGECRGGHQRG
jgi:hypothetical protein